MRDYGKVQTSFWENEFIRKMSEDARTMAFYILTSKHGTIVGAFILPDGYVSHDIKWRIERVTVALEELVLKGFLSRCSETNWVWVRRYLEWNKLENPNQCKAARKIALMIPLTCSWRDNFMGVNGSILGITTPSRSSGFATVSKAPLNQEQEQEQEQEQDQDQDQDQEQDTVKIAAPCVASQQTTVCVVLKAEGIQYVRREDAVLKTLINNGAEIDHFIDAAKIATASGKPNFCYVLGIVKRRMIEAAAHTSGGLAKQKSSIPHGLQLTTPGRTGPDPELIRLGAEREAWQPPPAAVREKLRALSADLKSTALSV